MFGAMDSYDQYKDDMCSIMCNACDSFDFFFFFEKNVTHLVGWLLGLSEFCVLHMTKTNIIFLLVMRVQTPNMFGVKL